MSQLLFRATIIVWAGALAGFLYAAFLHTELLQTWGVEREVPLAEDEAVDTISLAAAKQDFDHRAAVFVDARSSKMYAVGHIPGALNLPIDDTTSWLRQKLSPYPKDAKIIAYCSGSRCQISRRLAKRLVEELDYRRVYVLTEGLLAWLAVGFPEAVGSVSVP